MAYFEITKKQSTFHLWDVVCAKFAHNSFSSNSMKAKFDALSHKMNSFND